MIAIIQNFLLFSFVYLSLFKCYDSTELSVATPRVYKVIEINKSRKSVNNTNKAYIILVQDTVSKQYYTIVSLKSNNKTSIKIREGASYCFSLKKYFEHDYVIQLGLRLSVYIEGVLINIPMGYYSTNIYTTENLKGIYYHYP